MNNEVNSLEAQAIKPIVAAYYFPNFHRDERNAIVHGANWTEWEVLKQAKPRFEGHRAPFVPLWGHQDEADPEVMENKIACSLKYGVDAFIFDWYYYDDGEFLNGCLDNGYLKAKNRGDHKFALMWANHDWRDIMPAKLTQSDDILYRGKVADDTMLRIADVVATRYFSDANYLQVDGRPYFSIYDLCSIVDQAGGLEEAAAQLDRFRARIKEVCGQEVHLNGVIFRAPILQGERVPMAIAELVKTLKLDSVTSYVWVHYCPDLNQSHFMPYTEARDLYFEAWKGLRDEVSVPFYPNVTVGWDPSPRTLASDTWEMRRYPFSGILTGSTPEIFGEAASECLQDLFARGEFPLLTINAWNEWTEGSYLEPDTHFGYGYLEAIQKAKAQSVSKFACLQPNVK